MPQPLKAVKRKYFLFNVWPDSAETRYRLPDAFGNPGQEAGKKSAIFLIWEGVQWFICLKALLKEDRLEKPDCMPISTTERVGFSNSSAALEIRWAVTYSGKDIW